MAARDTFKGIASILHHLAIKVIRDRETEFRALIPGDSGHDYWVVVKRVKKADVIVPESEMQMSLGNPVPDLDDIA